MAVAQKVTVIRQPIERGNGSPVSLKQAAHCHGWSLITASIWPCNCDTFGMFRPWNVEDWPTLKPCHISSPNSTLPWPRHPGPLPASLGLWCWLQGPRHALDGNLADATQGTALQQTCRGHQLTDHLGTLGAGHILGWLGLITKRDETGQLMAWRKRII